MPAKHALAETEPRALTFRKATCVVARVTTLDQTVNVSLICYITSLPQSKHTYCFHDCLLLKW